MINGDVREWVSRAQAGDSAAFGLLYDRYVDDVFRLVMRRTSGDRLVAEDLTSETFLRALRNITSFTWLRGSDFGAWLGAIARNLVADHFRTTRRRREVLTEVMWDADRVDPNPEAGPELLAVNRVTADDLLVQVRKLGVEQQRCIVLRFLRGLSVSETAALMGRTEVAVKLLQHRALQALRGLLPATAVMPA